MQLFLLREPPLRSKHIFVPLLSKTAQVEYADICSGGVYKNSSMKTDKIASLVPRQLTNV